MRVRLVRGMLPGWLGVGFVVLTAWMGAARAGTPVNVLTFHNDNLRSGQNSNETALTPANVNVATFGKIFSDPVDGAMYAEPLYVSQVSIPGNGVHDVVYAATAHDSVYAFDAESGGMLWHTSFINPPATTAASSADVGCADISPEVGVIGTPVIDLGRQALYAVAKIKNQNTGAITLSLHALDLATGAEKFGGPTIIAGTARGVGDGSIRGALALNSTTANQRAALLLANGKVYVAFASHCDRGPYHGWVLAYDALTLTPQRGAFNTTPNGNQGGIWQSGNGPSSDGSFIFVGIGNGTFDANTGGGDYGDSFVKLNPKTLKVKGYFTPSDQHSMQKHDADNGSTGAIILPKQSGPVPLELMGGGKDGTMYILNRQRLGRYCPPPCDDKRAVEALNQGQLNALFSAPAYWNGMVYVASASDPLMSFALSNGLLSTSPTAASSITFGIRGASPSVSANGTADGIVWALENGDGSGAPAVLYAFDAANVSNELYDSTQSAMGRDTAGPAVKFTTPMIANGHVYVGTQSELDAYGLLP